MSIDGRITIARLWQTVSDQKPGVERLDVNRFEPLSMLHARVYKAMGCDGQLYVSGFGDAIARVVWLPREDRELFSATLTELVGHFHRTPRTHFDNDHVDGKRSMWGKAYCPLPYYYWAVTPLVHESHQRLESRRQFA